MYGFLVVHVFLFYFFVVLINFSVGVFFCCQVSHFDQHWSNAKMKGYEAFVVELKETVDVCIDRNIHKRTKRDIEHVCCTCTVEPVYSGHSGGPPKVAAIER